MGALAGCTPASVIAEDGKDPVQVEADYAACGSAPDRRMDHQVSRCMAGRGYKVLFYY